MYSRRFKKLQHSANLGVLCAIGTLALFLAAGCQTANYEIFGTSDAQAAKAYWANLEAAHHSKTERRKMMPPERCQLCTNTMVWATSIEDTTELASKNLELLAGAANPTPLAFAASKVCTNCWHSYNAVWGRTERSTRSAADFQPPLHRSIADFPTANLPLESAPVFKQALIGNFVRQEIAFWVNDNQMALDQIKNWSARNNLLLEVEKGREKKSLFIRATHFNPRYK